MRKDGENKEAKGGENKGAGDASTKPVDPEAEAEAKDARIAELEAENAELREELDAADATISDFQKRDADRGLKIKELQRDQHQGAMFQPGKRLYLNAKKDRLYPEGHKEAASLYCTEHSRVPRAEFERLKGK